MDTVLFFTRALYLPDISYPTGPRQRNRAFISERFKTGGCVNPRSRSHGCYKHLICGHGLKNCCVEQSFLPRERKYKKGALPLLKAGFFFFILYLSLDLVVYNRV